jgi:ATP-dependent phosphofructokinase / diphosphate-dependent phosphofructokinase
MIIWFFPATADPALRLALNPVHARGPPRGFSSEFAHGVGTMKIGMLTGGGDCPGLNAVLRAVVRKGVFTYGDEFVGFTEGWRGLLDDKSMRLDLDAVSGILPRGGTILRTSRTNPSKHHDGIERCVATLEKNHIEALVAIGGDDTLSVAQKLHEHGAKVVGVPKTIDNDLGGTDYTFGFDTACNIVCEALDRVHTTAEAHNRVMVVEVMGRDAGWIALYSGIAGGADVILIPERPFDVDKVADSIRQRHERGRYFSIVVVAEGAKFSSEPGQGSPILQDMGKDEFGHAKLGGIANILAREIEKRTGFETRPVVLGHIQRGGSPSAFDRVLATRYGLGAIDMVHRGEFGCMAALRANKIVSIPLVEAIARNRVVDDDMIKVVDGLFQKAADREAAGR